MVAVGVAAASAACTAEVSDPRYGPPGGLRNSQLPAPGSTTTGTGTGTAPPAGSGDGGTTTPATCTVSFKTDIYPMMTDQGPWKCSNSACHGTQAGTPPFIDPASATNAYTNLAKDTSAGGKPFINANSTDPTASGFLCCLAGTCGAAMPVPGGGGGATAATQAQTDKVSTWLKCGAPNN